MENIWVPSCSLTLVQKLFCLIEFLIASKIARASVAPTPGEPPSALGQDEYMAITIPVEGDM